MASKYKLYKGNKKSEYNNSKYVKCLAEGIHDWMEIKIKTGSKDLMTIRSKMEKEISSYSKNNSPKVFSVHVMKRMREEGVKDDKLEEFKGIFVTSLRA